METQLIDPAKAALVERVTSLMLEGRTVAAAVKSVGITMQQLHRAIASERELAVRYAQAMQMRADIWADETIEIADTDPDAQRARNRIQTRQWGAEKAHPARYGQRMELNINQQISIDGALKEANARLLRPVRDQLDVTDVETHEPQRVQAPRPTDCESAAPPAEPVEPDIFS